MKYLKKFKTQEEETQWLNSEEATKVSLTSDENDPITVKVTSENLFRAKYDFRNNPNDKVTITNCGNIFQSLIIDEQEYSEEIIIIDNPKSIITVQGVINPSINTIPQNGFKDTDIVSVIIPEGITTIGDKAFFNCLLMQSAHLPQTIKTIGNCAFANSIRRISCINEDLAKNVASNAFAFDNYIKAIVHIDEYFVNKEFYLVGYSRGSLAVQDFDLSQVEKMIIDGKEVTPAASHIFDKVGDHTVEFYFKAQDLNLTCLFAGTLYKNITFNIVTSYVIDMNACFFYSIDDSVNYNTTINFININTDNLTSFEGAFYGNHMVKHLDLSNVDLSNVVNMSTAFCAMSNCETIKLGKINPNANITNIFDDTDTPKTIYYDKRYNYTNILSAIPNNWTAISY